MFIRNHYYLSFQKKKSELNFDPMCRQVVVRRMVEQTTDVRLNPDLYQACRRDMAKFCSELVEQMELSSTELNGKLTECLKVRAVLIVCNSSFLLWCFLLPLFPFLCLLSFYFFSLSAFVLYQVFSDMFTSIMNKKR